MQNILQLIAECEKIKAVICSDRSYAAAEQIDYESSFNGFHRHLIAFRRGQNI